jgi:ferredoxin
MPQLFNDQVIVCNCGGTMDIDGKKLAKSCGATGSCDVATSLCRTQTDRLAAAMTAARNSKTKLIVACTQETATFDAIAEELGYDAPQTVNIRELAGWSDESAKALPKMAALMRHAADSYRAGRSLSLLSQGRCLIYADAGRANGGSDAALALGAQLNGTLGVTVMIANADDTIAASATAGLVTTGTIQSATGHFTNFDLVINKFAEAAPHSRENLVFGARQDGVETSCDLLIDLTGGTPFFSGWEKRDGYFRARADDSLAMARIEREAKHLIGEFEKPIYVNFDDNICAHSRNKIGGCSRCLDVCPAGAITSLGDHVNIDPAICGGCGLCAAVCPSGAAQTAYPPADQLLSGMAQLLAYYHEAGGKSASLLLHDDSYGLEVIEMMARYGRGLPSHVIPVSMHAMGRAGHDLMVNAIALGYQQVFVLLNPAKSVENAPLAAQYDLAVAMLDGVGVHAKNQIILIDDSDPDAVAEILYNSPIKPKGKPAPFSPVGTPRGMVRLAMRGLASTNNSKHATIALPDSAPYGRVTIDTDNCTICLSCVSACPAGALQDNPDAPQLLFREDACLQCGICVATCPEKVIALTPQFNLADSAMSAELVIEDTPFACTECGKPFGSAKSIEKIITRLSGHSMFQQGARTDMLKMCEDCRVEAMFAQNDKTMDIAERRKPRTTDDYLN